MITVGPRTVRAGRGKPGGGSSLKILAQVSDSGAGADSIWVIDAADATISEKLTITGTVETGNGKTLAPAYVSSTGKILFIVDSNDMYSMNTDGTEETQEFDGETDHGWNAVHEVMSITYPGGDDVFITVENQQHGKVALSDFTTFNLDATSSNLHVPGTIDVGASRMIVHKWNVDPRRLMYLNTSFGNLAYLSISANSVACAMDATYIFEMKETTGLINRYARSDFETAPHPSEIVPTATAIVNGSQGLEAKQHMLRHDPGLDLLFAYHTANKKFYTFAPVPGSAQDLADGTDLGAPGFSGTETLVGFQLATF